MASTHGGNALIPWAKPRFWGNEESYVVEALRTSWISGGPFVERLESSLAQYLGCKHALAVANGTAALHLAYLALDLKPGDEVIVPAFGFMAAANVALNLRLRPVFCDVDTGTWCMRSEDVSPKITSRTRAIVAVHTYGNVCDIHDLIALGDRHGIPVVEDTAEALGSRIGSRMAGSLGAVNTFSFHATKTITTGEGGLVTTNDDAMADRMRLFRSHGLRRERHYWHELPGLNFRLTNMQAALGCAQFENIDRILASREDVFSAYRREVASMQGVKPQEWLPGSAIWAVALALSPSAYPQGRDAVIKSLTAAGIETRPGFVPPAGMSYFDPVAAPASDHLGEWVLSLPTFPGLSEGEIAFICGKLAELAAG